MVDTASDTLRRNFVFQSLEISVIEELARLSKSRAYQKGEFLCLQGEAWPNLFIVSRGVIHAYKESEEGRSLLITSLNPGEMFWGLAFFEADAPMPVRLEAHDPSHIYFWSRAQCLPLFTKHGELSWAVSRLLVQRMLYASDIVEGLAFQPVASRLARLLLEIYPSDQQLVERNITLDEMAARIGSTREMVCRILYKFATQGAIQIHRTEFIFTDRKLLEKLV